MNLFEKNTENQFNRGKLILIQAFVNDQQQQSKQSQNNDECSSGGTTPTLIDGPRGSANSDSQNIKKFLQLAVWTQQRVFDKFNECKMAGKLYNDGQEIDVSHQVKI